MLVKCSVLDKFHVCLAQDHLITRMDYWMDLMAEAIYCRIPQDIKLPELFMRWIQLSPDDRNSIDGTISSQNITSRKFNLYVPLKRALIYWDHMQDTSGAPGVQSDVFAFTCDKNLEEELVELIARVDHLIDLDKSVMSSSSFDTENETESVKQAEKKKKKSVVDGEVSVNGNKMKKTKKKKAEEKENQ